MNPISIKDKLIYVLIAAVTVLLLQSCDGFSLLPNNKEEATESNGKRKNGLIKTFRKDRSLYSEVNYVNGVKHGISKSYSKRGKLLFIIPYDSGKKEGVSKMYYADGKVRRETEYSNGRKNGIRKSYWTTGVVSSTISYKNDLPANDLKEFMKSGEEKNKYEELQVSVIDNLETTGEYIVKIKFSKNSKRADYYIGELDGGKYFNENNLRQIPEQNGEGIMLFTPAPGVFIMERLNIIGKLKTARGNILIRQKKFNLAIEGSY